MKTITALALCMLACNKARPWHDIVIRVTHDGIVKLGGETVTLAQLGQRLGDRCRGAPMEEVRPYVKASTLTVCLMVDPEAAWLHVDFVRTVLMENKFHRLSFDWGREAPLPVDVATYGESDVRGSPPAFLLVRFGLTASGEYRFGARSTTRIAEVEGWLDALPSKPGLRPVGILRPEAGTRWQQVEALFDLLRRKGVERIAFQGCCIPFPALRALSPLPVPRPGRPVPEWKGLVEVPTWDPDDCLLAKTRFPSPKRPSRADALRRRGPGALRGAGSGLNLQVLPGIRG